MDIGIVFGIFLATAIPLGIVILLFVYINKTNSLQHKMELMDSIHFRLRSLEDDIAELRRKLIPHSEPVPPSGKLTNEVQATPVRTPEPQPAASVSVSIPVDKPRTQAPAVSPPPLPQPASPSRTREEWEALIGGKLLNRIGALALIIGVGFFLKYAFDNNWITETMRVVIGFVIGAGLLVGAGRANKSKLEVFAQGLVGAGLAVLYLSVFATFNFYHLVPQTVAFLMMSGVTILAFLQGFKYDSLAVSMLGLVGGFLTPFLLSTGESNEVGLFTYIALLDAGLLAVLLMKDSWAMLEPLALAATYLVYLLWYREYYEMDQMLATTYFLVVFWMLFYAMEIYRALKKIATSVEVRTAVATANALFFYSAIYSLIEPGHHEVMGLITLILGVAYFGTALIVQRRNPDGVNVFFRQVLIAIILLVAATAIQFTGFKTVVWWSVEALVLILLGLRFRRDFVWLSGIAIYGCALLKLLYNPDSFSTSPVVDAGLLLNQRAFTFAILAASMGICADWLNRAVEERRLLFARILNYIWPVLVLALITVETTGYFKSIKLTAAGTSLDRLDFNELMTLGVVWMLYSLPLFWFGMIRKEFPWQHTGLGVALLSVCLAAIRGLSFMPVADFQLVANFRFLTMIIVVAGTFVLARWIRNRTPLGSWNAEVLGAVGVIIVILMLVLVTGETKDYFEKAKVMLGGTSYAAEYSRLNNLQQLSLSGVWLFYSIALMVVGIWRRHRGIRIASIVLFGFTILKIFIYDLSFLDTLYRIFSFIGLGVILLAVSYLYQKYKSIILGESKSGMAGTSA